MFNQLSTKLSISPALESIDTMGGAYLSRPVKEKVSEDGSNSRVSYGVSSMQGWRLKQEVL